MKNSNKKYQMNLTHSWNTNMRSFKRFPSNEVELGQKNKRGGTDNWYSKLKILIWTMHNAWQLTLTPEELWNISQLFRIIRILRQLFHSACQLLLNVSWPNVIFHQLLTSAVSRVTLFHSPLQTHKYHCFTIFLYHSDPIVS